MELFSVAVVFVLLDILQHFFILSTHNYSRSLGWFFSFHLLKVYLVLFLKSTESTKMNWKMFTARFLMTQVILLSWISFLSCPQLKTKKWLNLVGLNKRRNAVQGRFLLCRRQGWLKVPVGIWSPLALTANAVMPTDSLYCYQLNGIMSVWKVFENELKIIFTSGWLLLPHVNRTLSEWPRFLRLH